MHYIEYLSLRIRKHKIDTIGILNADDLETVVRRAAKKLPPNCFGTPREMYKNRLKQVQYAYELAVSNKNVYLGFTIYRKPHLIQYNLF